MALPFQFPFLSRAAHVEIVVAKDETIAAMRLINSVLIEQMGRTHPTAAAAQPPTVAAVSRDKAKASDYASIDPADNDALMRLALREMGPGARSASLLQRKIEHIREQVKQARGESKHRREEPGILATPASVMERIDQAEQQGRQAAGLM